MAAAVWIVAGRVVIASSAEASEAWTSVRQQRTATRFIFIICMMGDARGISEQFPRRAG